MADYGSPGVSSPCPFRPMPMRSLFALLGCFLVNHVLAAQCVAQSGPRTAVLVELYASEGCSTCTLADRWLPGLAPAGYAPDRVVPLALHVDYWDYIGWKGPWAKREFSLRQRKLSQLQRMALVYTPQVMLQGRDFRDWGGKAFDDAVAKINARPPPAPIRPQIHAAKGTLLDVAAAAELVAPPPGSDPALYLAAYPNRPRRRLDPR